MAQALGTIGTESLTAGGQRIVDMSANAQFYDSDETKILAILHKANLTKVVTGNRKFDWREDDLLLRGSRLTAAVTATTGLASTYTADLSTVFRADDLILNPVTKEIILATTVTAGGMTVTRGYGTEVAASFVQTTSDVWVVLGNCKTEGSAVRTVIQTSEADVFNFTQEFTMPVKTNWELQGQKLYGMDERRKQQFKMGIDHKKDIALSLWFGQRNSTTNITAVGGAAVATPRYACNGIYNIVQASVGPTYGTTTLNRLFDAGGQMLQAEWEQWLRACKRYNQSGEMWVFASSLVWSVVNGYAAIGTNRVIPNDMMSKSYGFEISQYVVPGLRVNLVEEKLFDEFVAGTGLGYADTAIALDLGKVSYRYQEGWDTKLIENIVQDGTHAYVDEYTTICGPQVFLPKAHGIMRGVTS